MLKAIVVTPNSQTSEWGAILAIARAEARSREQSRENPPIRALKYFPELSVYVAVYEATDNQLRNPEQGKPLKVSKWEKSLHG